MYDQGTIDKLKAEHGDGLTHLRAAGHDVVVKRPSRLEWRRFLEAAADASKRARAVETLFLAAVVHPDKKAVAEILEARPALAERFGDEVAKLAGAEEVVEKNAL
jgi:hypothetical protein